MQDVAILTFPIETALTALSTSRRVNSRTFSQAVPKRDQWKIAVRIHASSRGQDGSDAGPASFELRVFEQVLRQKQHRWGAAWGIRLRFNQRFCIERALARHRRALRAIACKMWLYLPKGKGCRRLQPSCQLDFQHLEMASLVMSSPICSSCLSDRNCSYSLQHIQPSHFCSWKFVCERSQAIF